MLTLLVSLQQGNVKQFEKLTKIVNTQEDNLHILCTSRKISTKFSGKVWLMIVLKVTKKQGFTLSLKNTFWVEIPQVDIKLTPTPATPQPFSGECIYFHMVYLTVSSSQYNFFFLMLFYLLTWLLFLLSFKSSDSFHLLSEILATQIVCLTVWHQLILKFWLVNTSFFAHSRDQRSVTHLKNVRQLNKRRGKKLSEFRVVNLYVLTNFWMLSMVVTVFEAKFTL